MRRAAPWLVFVAAWAGMTLVAAYFDVGAVATLLIAALGLVAGIALWNAR